MLLVLYQLDCKELFFKIAPFSEISHHYTMKTSTLKIILGFANMVLLLMGTEHTRWE
jgi:hypothetical protein